ncbi:SRPBCC family protein [Rhodopseudomonas palustris]|uniref:Activator of Hsp90 ATPase homologue 1/2-like C-terminal domain-containing protein n=1 Tax=Rhodopseudomonas palustris (strain BisB18) TaxID=316056 RepID=Q20XJ4_RHOPB
MTSIEPIRKQIVVDTPPDRAFRVFTEQHGAWWPLETHHVGDKPAETAIIEPKAGGRWFERSTDGTEHLWGRVLVWEPPQHLVMTWEINGDWKHDDALVTEVDVRFVPVGAKQTRIEFEHRLLENYGANAHFMRAPMDGGWSSFLELFGAQTEKA